VVSTAAAAAAADSAAMVAATTEEAAIAEVMAIAMIATITNTIRIPDDFVMTDDCDGWASAPKLEPQDSFLAIPSAACEPLLFADLLLDESSSASSCNDSI
jgi:hypothetical protein